jgi:hypothetical protein
VLAAAQTHVAFKQALGGEHEDGSMEASAAGRRGGTRLG